MIQCFSQFLNIVPFGQNIDKTLEHMAKRLSLCFVDGDHGNDLNLFFPPFDRLVINNEANPGSDGIHLH
ncbi:hypothetical protein D3C87_2109880 [compost metagenome]